MSTEIYELIDIRRNGVWEAVWLFPELDTSTSFSDPQWEAYWTHPAYIDRNYPLFSVLGGARNSFGLIPIGSWRGLPADASAEARARYVGYYERPTWVSLRELLDYNWDQMIQDSRHGHEPPRLLRDEVEPFTSKTLPYLQSLVDNPDDLRIICDFD